MSLLAPSPKPISIAFLGLLLSGCMAVGSNYVKPSPSAPETWHQVSSRAGTTASASPVALSEWWQQLHDPLLSSLITQAFGNSPDLRSAQAKLQEARARRELAGEQRLPTVSGSFSASRTKSSRQVGTGATSNVFNAGFDASWEPDVFGGLSRTVEAAEADVGATQASLHDAQVSLAAEIALNYVELRSAQARLGIAKANLATQSETLQMTDWRAQAGLATALDVEQARSNLEQTQATIPNLNNSQTQAEHRLAILLGRFPGALYAQLAQPAALPAVPETVAVGIPADTLRQRPDVTAAERRLAAETARIGAETAALYPGFNLSGSLGWKALTLGALGSGVTAGVLGSVTQTIFDAGRIRSRISIQTAVQEQALVAYEKTVLAALEDVENALSAYANSRARLSALSQARAASRIAAKLARQQYESGLVDFQKVLDTQRTLLATEDSLASTEADGLTALISLYKAMGGGWQEQEPTAKE